MPDTSEANMIARLRSIGVSESYAHEIAKGVRVPGIKTAVLIWRELGLKMGALAGAADDVAERLALMHEQAAKAREAAKLVKLQRAKDRAKRKASTTRARAA